MSILIKGIDAPSCCADCWFRSEANPVHVRDGLYKYIYMCYLQPEYIEDGWKDMEWTNKNKHEWCPIIEQI